MKLVLGSVFLVMALTGFISSMADVGARSKSDIILTDKNTIVMAEEFNQSSVARVAQQAMDLVNANPYNKTPIYLVLNSGGGSIDAGAELIDNLSALNRPVYTINLFSASMAFMTSQSLGKRYITTHGTLMSHKARGGFQGEFPGQLDSRYAYWLKRVEMFSQRVVDRTNGKHTIESYNELIENEYWCTGIDCLSQGFVDEVVSVSCDSSLSGITEKEGNFSFFGSKVDIKVSVPKCPIITGSFSVSASLNGKEIINTPVTTSTSSSSIEVQVTVIPGLSAIETEALNQKINAVLEKFNPRRVVKGY